MPCKVGAFSPRMARHQVADGEDGLQIWKGAANIFNKQSQATDKGWYSNFSVERVAKRNSPLKIRLLRNVRKDLGFGRIL
jgi:hypothetical protein